MWLIGTILNASYHLPSLLFSKMNLFESQNYRDSDVPSNGSLATRAEGVAGPGMFSSSATGVAEAQAPGPRHTAFPRCNGRELDGK